MARWYANFWRPSGMAGLQEKLKALGKTAAAAKRDQAVREARALVESVKATLEDVFIGSVAADDDRQALAAAVKVIADACPRNAIMLLSVVEPAGDEPGKVAIMAQVPASLVARGLKAGDWVRETAAVVGGKGGGKPDQAQGGGSDTSKVRDAVSMARQVAARALLS